MYSHFFRLNGFSHTIVSLSYEFHHVILIMLNSILFEAVASRRRKSMNPINLTFKNAEIELI